MPYKFEENELLKLLIRAYDEGNCGFLDLAESVAEKIIGENKDKYCEDKSYSYMANYEAMSTTPTIIPPTSPFAYDPTFTPPPYTTPPPYNADVFPGSITISNGWTGEVNVANIQVDNLVDHNSNQVGTDVGSIIRRTPLLT